MCAFIRVCKRLNVPIETGGPSFILEYLGLTIKTIEMTIQIPENKLKELLLQIKAF